MLLCSAAAANDRHVAFQRLPDVVLSSLTPSTPAFAIEREEGALPAVIHNAELPAAGYLADWFVAHVTSDPTPAADANFSGVSDNGHAPPDTMGAVNSRFVMTVVNGTYRVQDRSGNILSSVSESSFWASDGAVNPGDPNLIFDRSSGRWFLTAGDSGATDSGAVDLAVSQSDDPTGTWSRFRYKVPSFGEWYDQPLIGVNQTTVVLSVNVAGGPSRPGGVFRADVFLFDKTQLLNGLASPAITSTSDGALCPAVVLDSGVTTNYLVQTAGSPIRLFDVSAAGVRQLASIPSPAAWASYPPQRLDFSPQLGTGVKINAGDSRLHSLIMRDGFLWLAHTVFLPQNAPTRSAIQWWKLTTSGLLADFGRIDDATGGVSYTYPSIAVNRNDDVLIGFSQFTSSEYASGAYAFRASTDPPGSFRAPVVLKAGESVYNKASPNRWGDYSNTVVDSDDLSFWTIQEYASTSSRWGTWWAHVPNQALQPATEAYADLVLKERPIAYYRLNETSGTTAFDSSSNARHARYVNVGVGQAQVTGATGQSETAASFNGSSSYVALPGSWGGWSSATIEAWVQIETGSDFEAIVSATGLSFIHFQYNATGNVAVYTDQPGQLPYLALPILNDSTGYGRFGAPSWHHVAIVSKSGSSCVFVNGTPLPGCITQTFSSILSSNEVRIGSGYAQKRFLKGAIAEVAIYDHALSDSQIRTHASAPFVRAGGRRRVTRH